MLTVGGGGENLHLYENNFIIYLCLFWQKKQAFFIKKTYQHIEYTKYRNTFITAHVLFTTAKVLSWYPVELILRTKIK